MSMLSLGYIDGIGIDSGEAAVAVHNLTGNEGGEESGGLSEV